MSKDLKRKSAWLLSSLGTQCALTQPLLASTIRQRYRAAKHRMQDLVLPCLLTKATHTIESM